MSICPTCGIDWQTDLVAEGFESVEDICPECGSYPDDDELFDYAEPASWELG